MRRARKLLPAPVGPTSSTGAVERTATFSICSMVRLKVALRVAMPLLRKETVSSASRAKRVAMAS